VEIWPRGLACHGGLPLLFWNYADAFHSRGAVRRLGNEPEPIGALDAIVAGLAVRVYGLAAGPVKGSGLPETAASRRTSNT